MQSSQGIFCEHIHFREGSHLLRLFMELVCTIRKQKQKKITFTIQRPNVFETQCLKALKSNIEQLVTAGISVRLSSSMWVEPMWNGKGNQREQNPGRTE